MNVFRTPTGSPFCAVCGHTIASAPGHYDNCPVLTGEPQQPFQWQVDQPYVGHPFGGLSAHGELPGQRAIDYTVMLARIAAALERIAKVWEETRKTEKK